MSSASFFEDLEELSHSPETLCHNMNTQSESLPCSSLKNKNSDNQKLGNIYSLQRLSTIHKIKINYEKLESNKF